MSLAEQMLFEFADELNTKRETSRRAVIEPPTGDYPDAEIFADTASVMSPASLTIQDSKGSMDLSNIPSMLQKIADNIVKATGRDVGVEMPEDISPEFKAIEQAMEHDEKLKNAVHDLARMMELKLDNLSDTSNLVGKRQIEEARRATLAMQSVDETQANMFDYQKEKDLDDARPISNPTGVDTEEEPQPQLPEKKDSGFFSGLMGGKEGRGGRMAGMLGFASRGLLGFGLALTLADAMTKQFFGTDLISAVTDGFKYLLDNWDKLIVQGLSSLFDVVLDLPSLIGQALSGIGKIIGSVLLSVLNKLPFVGDLFPKDVTEMFQKDENGQDMFDRNSAATQILGTAGAVGAVGTKTGRSVLSKTANMLTGGLSGKRMGASTPASAAAGVPPAGTASSARPGLLARGMNAIKATKYGKMAALGTVSAGALYGAFSGDDEPEVTEGIRSDVKQDSDMGMGMPLTAAAAAATGVGAYAYNKRSQAKMVRTPPGVPDAPRFDLPKPSSGPVGKAASGLGSLLSPDSLKGAGKFAMKTAGRLPLVSSVVGGIDAYSAYSDDTLTDHEKNTQYAGVGGTLAGGAAGASLGALMGTAIFPGLGTAVGGIAGGALGAITGEDGVEAVYDWLMGPDASEGQTLTDTGVGKDNIPSNIRTNQATDFDIQLNSLLGIPDTQESGVPYAGPFAQDYTPSVDEQVMYAQDKAQQISDKSLGTTKVETAKNYVDQLVGLAPDVTVTTQPVSDFSGTQQDSEDSVYAMSPKSVSSQPTLETGIDNNEDIRSQTANIPEIIVNVEQQAPVPEKKKQGVVAKRVTANVPTEKKRTGFQDKPSLLNVPVVMEDTGFILLNQGYV
jgi:hypothetical protein